MDILDLLNQKQQTLDSPSYFDRLSMNPFFQTGVGILSNNTGNYGAFAPAVGQGMQAGMKNIEVMRQNQFNNQEKLLQRFLSEQQIQGKIDEMKAKREADKAAENQVKYYFKSAGLDYENLDKEFGGFLPVGASGQTIQSSPIPSSSNIGTSPPGSNIGTSPLIQSIPSSDVTQSNPGIPKPTGIPQSMEQTASIAGNDLFYAPPQKPSRLKAALDKWGWSPEEQGMLAYMAQSDPKGAAVLLKNEMILRRKKEIIGNAEGKDALAKERAIQNEIDMGTPLGQRLAAEKMKPLATVENKMAFPIQNYLPASEEAQKDFMKGLRASYDSLKGAPALLSNIEQAKNLVIDAKEFTGPLANQKLGAVKFMRSLGMPIATSGVQSAEQLRTRMFMVIMDNLKKMDAQPSEMQQRMMMDALGNLGTDPAAIGGVMDVMGGMLRDKISLHNSEAQDSINRGIKFPYNPIINPDVFTARDKTNFRPQNTQTITPSPKGVDPNVWKYMTPNERALWTK